MYGSSELYVGFASWWIFDFDGGEDLIFFTVICFLIAEEDGGLCCFFWVVLW